MAIISGGRVIEGALPRVLINDAGDVLGNYGPYVNAGAPAGGLLNGKAAKGALLIDITNAILYINTGTLAATVWTKVGTQT